MPAMTPGRASGSVTVKKNPGRPRAKSCRCRLKPRIDILNGKPHGPNHKGETHDRTGESSARPAKGKDNPEIAIKKASNGTFDPKGYEEEVTRYHRRHDERQMHHPV